MEAWFKSGPTSEWQEADEADVFLKGAVLSADDFFERFRSFALWPLPEPQLTKRK